MTVVKSEIDRFAATIWLADYYRRIHKENKTPYITPKIIKQFKKETELQSITKENKVDIVQE